MHASMHVTVRQTSMLPLVVLQLLLLRTAKGSACYLRKPRRCGPLISPGGYTLPALHPRAAVPLNLLFLNMTGTAGSSTLVCVPAKAGSTSFFFWLYRVLAGADWPYKGPPWVQDVSSSRWQNLSASVVRIVHLPLRARTHILTNAGIRRYALVRHPLERGISAYHSKVACNMGDIADHAGAIRQLILQAPRAATALGLNGMRQTTASVKSIIVDLGNESTSACISAEHWLRLLSEAQIGSRRQEINPHFMTQADACWLHHIGYHHIVPLEDSAHGIQHLAAHLGVKNSPRLSKSHATRKSNKQPFSREAVALLQNVYHEDLELLKYPSERAAGNRSSYGKHVPASPLVSGASA